MDDTRRRPRGANEGDASKSADEEYRKSPTDFARRTDALQTGLELERDVENYRDEYDQAEKAGRSHSAGDLQRKNDGYR